jgi:predicted N-acetyltransferase YhbS
MVTVRQERPAEAASRDALLDLAYGPARFTKASERLREGRRPELALVAAEGGRIVGTVRLWQVSAGPGRPALLLGPLAVAPDRRRRGIGSTLVHHALREAARRRHSAVLLVGDMSYYARFGFSGEKTGTLWLPGPLRAAAAAGVRAQARSARWRPWADQPARSARAAARSRRSGCGPRPQR